MRSEEFEFKIGQRLEPLSVFFDTPGHRRHKYAKGRTNFHKIEVLDVREPDYVKLSGIMAWGSIRYDFWCSIKQVKQDNHNISETPRWDT